VRVEADGAAAGGGEGEVQAARAIVSSTAPKSLLIRHTPGPESRAGI
jgi:hypothetical protein